MAKEQKAIAIWYKNGREIEFERFAIKTPKKILSNCVAFYAENLSLFKETLKEFDSFVIYSTDSYGENKVVEMELTDRQFLNLVKEHYKDYSGVYPNEDKFDSERWEYIMSGHSFKEDITRDCWSTWKVIGNYSISAFFDGRKINEKEFDELLSYNGIDSSYKELQNVINDYFMNGTLSQVENREYSIGKNNEGDMIFLQPSVELQEVLGVNDNDEAYVNIQFLLGDYKRNIYSFGFNVKTICAFKGSLLLDESKKTLKESSSKDIVAKLDKQFDNISVGIINDLAEEDSITLSIKSYDDSKEILNYVRKELRGYNDVEIDYDSSNNVVLIFFYDVSSYSDRELIQTIEDLVWTINAKFDIEY